MASMALLACTLGLGFNSLGLSAWARVDEDVPRDTLIVNGLKVAYRAEVDVDTLVNASLAAHVDWWFGAGMDLTWPNAFVQNDVPLSAIGTTRPFFRMERRHSGKKGLWGIHCTYHQPWKLSEAEVSPYVKGWIVNEDDDVFSSSGLRQIALIPDSLAFERDTLLAPVSAGHALRIGGSWERVTFAKWHLWLAGSMTVFRPTAWQLASPQDPTTWRGTVATDTYAKSGWLTGRFRLEVGSIVDLGRSHRGRRSASQLRVSLFGDSPKSWGGRVMLVVSPTRR